MNRIEWQINNHGDFVLLRDGKWLCSPREPWKEGLSWAQTQKIESFDKEIVVLGVGAGYHVRALNETLKAAPWVVGAGRICNFHITCFELDPELISFWKGHDYQRFGFGIYPEAELDILESKKADLVLCFRPSWSGLEKKYMSVYVHLIERVIKELNLNSSNGRDQKFKIWKALGELIL